MKENHHEDYMRLAITKAKEGVDKGQSPFGACIVNPPRRTPIADADGGGEIIACEHNIVWESTDITAHAEIHAIRSACKTLSSIDLSGCVIYSTCEPCPMCFSAIHWARIDKVYYGAEISDAQRFGFNEITVSNQTMKEIGESEVQIEGGILRDECVALFEYWNSKADKRTY